MMPLRKYAITAGAAFILGLLLGLFGPRLYEAKTRPLPDAAQGVAVHDVHTEVPVKALDKTELKKRNLIPHSALRNPQSEVLAASTVKDSSGTRNIAAALDVKTGYTQLVQQRPFAEWMHTNALGIGVGYGKEGVRKEIFYRHKFARLWEFYPAFGAAIGKNETAGTDWLLRLDLTYEW